MQQNPFLNLAQQLKAASSPMGMLNQMAQNAPQGQKFLEMTQGKTPQEIEETAKNYFKTVGVDINKFRQQMGL